LWGFLGLLLTGILLPFLGLFVVKLHKGNYHAFFEEAGPFAKILLPLFTLSLLGSFGVVPRCITVAYGGMQPMMPELSLSMFSVIFSLITFFFCMKDQRMIKIMGQWMSPILCGSLAVLVIAGIFAAPTVTSTSILPTEAFHTGFLTGYQTMDLFAAFFFSALVFSQIQKMLPEETSHKTVIKFAIKPSILGAGLLALVYLGFVFLGAHFRGITQNVEPEFMLSTIAYAVLGRHAMFFLGIAMVFSCLTTAVALNNIYARYLCGLLKLKEERFPLMLSTTTSVACAISLLDFKRIALFLGPLLEVSYPSIIMLTILSIITPRWGRTKKILFYGILMLMILKEWGGR
jgi:LIVCS family branched-chain amino acid:cation transporter